MSLLDEVRALSAPRYSVCSVPGVLASLAEDDAADLRAAFDDPTIPAIAIDRALVNRGVHLKAQTIRRHRRKDCSCPA